MVDFPDFLFGILTREVNFSYTGAIRRSDMLHRKWHERPIRSAWKTTEEEHHAAETEWLEAQKQRGGPNDQATFGFRLRRLDPAPEGSAGGAL